MTRGVAISHEEYVAELEKARKRYDEKIEAAKKRLAEELENVDARVVVGKPLTTEGWEPREEEAAPAKRRAAKRDASQRGRPRTEGGPSCHPDRKHYAKDRCRQCYDTEWRAGRRARRASRARGKQRHGEVVG